MAELAIGIVGLGHVAGHQIAALDRTRGVRLAALCDRDPAKRALAPEGVPFHTDLDRFLVEAEVDVVVVSVPPSSHVPVARTALEAGRDVLVEKPLATDLGEIDALRAVAETHGRLTYSALHAAHGREVLWFLDDAQEEMRAALGPVTGFACRFYDPYIGPDGRLQPGARSLGGAWLDSAINALSVVGRFVDPDLMALEHATMTRLPGSEASELQGSADYVFPVAGGASYGRGTIDTNWTLGLNSKTTRLGFASGAEIVLEHSDETVLRLDRSGNSVEPTVIADLSDGTPRLTAHYFGVFDELVTDCAARRSNVAWSRRLHELMLDAHGFTHSRNR